MRRLRFDFESGGTCALFRVALCLITGAQVILRERHSAEYRCRIIKRCIQIDSVCLLRLGNSREDAIDNERMLCSAHDISAVSASV